MMTRRLAVHAGTMRSKSSNFGMQPTALRAAADTGRYAP